MGSITVSDDYVFTIIGKGSTEFTSLCGMTGNSQYDCSSCLTLIDFPEYPYYPQVVTIEVRSLEQTSDYVTRIRLFIYDCDNDDPTCEEYYDLDELHVFNNDNIVSEGELEETSNANKLLPSDEFEGSFLIFDVLGRQISNENERDLRIDEVPKGEILIFVFYDSHGNIVDVKKKIYIH